MPLTVFLYTGFIRALPARVRGGGTGRRRRLLRTYFRVVFPLLRPVTGTVAVLTGLVIWNDFFTR